jgi:2-keto-3-deoxy-L-rhamnonate aldolase RhmA
MSSVAQLKACMAIPGDMEHTPGVGNLTRAFERYQAGGWRAYMAPLRDDARTFPIVAYIEDARLVDQIEEIVAVEGLMAVGFGLHDVCTTLGHPFDVEHPSVWKVIDRVVELARPRGISVWANTGTRYSKVDESIDRIERLYSHGVDTIQVQSPLIYLFPTLEAVSIGAHKRVGQ